MADNNKVLFGFSELHIGTYTVDDDGNVTLGEPYHQKGAVGYSPEADNEEVDFWADNVDYFNEQTTGTRSGDLVVAKFDDTFKEQFLGYKRSSGGGLAEVINPVKPRVYVAFQIDGDVDNVRHIMYNGSLGSIDREFNTMEGTREPVTESLPVKFIGDKASGIIVDNYHPGDAGYEDLFSNPPVPGLADESES